MLYKKAEDVIKEWRKSRADGIELSLEQFKKYVQQVQKFPHTPIMPEFSIHSNFADLARVIR